MGIYSLQTNICTFLLIWMAHLTEHTTIKINMLKKITPSMIPVNHWFMGSVFQNSESETILSNIVKLQRNVNPEEWTPFSWEDYKKFCSHEVSDIEHNVLNAFVNGGKPVRNTSAILTSGWLNFDGTHYFFTEKMITMLYEKFGNL